MPRDMQWWSEDVPRGLRYFDNQNIQDMNQDAQEEAKTTSRRVEKLGKAFQNYRRAILNIHRDMVKQTRFVVACRRQERSELALADLVWAEDGMAYVLQTVASFEKHKARWLQKRPDRLAKNHQDFW